MYVLPGHAETISTVALSPTFDKAGVTVECLGEGDNRPIWTFTHVDASFIYSAANVKFIRPLSKTDVDSHAIVHDVNAADVTIVDPELRTGSAKQYLTGIDITGSGANACDRAKVVRPVIIQTAAGGAQGIELGEVADHVVIEGAVILGDWSAAGIHNPTGKILTNLHLDGGTIQNLSTGNHAVELVSACTGAADDLKMYGDTLGTVLDPGSLKCNGCTETDAIDQAGVPSPITAAGSLGAGAIGASTFQAGAIDATAIANGAIDAATFAAGAIDAGAIANAAIDAATFAAGAIDAAALAADAVAAIGANTGPGSSFVVSKTVVQSAIIAAGADLTAVSTTGAVLIEDVIIQNAGTACVSGANMAVLEIYSNNVAGAGSFITDAEAKLGANVVVSDATHTTKNKLVLETGKKVTVKATTEDFTSGGNITFHLICRRLAAGAGLTAA